jgi:hypothetical protein
MREGISRGNARSSNAAYVRESATLPESVLNRARLALSVERKTTQLRTARPIERTPDEIEELYGYNRENEDSYGADTSSFAQDDNSANHDLPFQVWDAFGTIPLAADATGIQEAQWGEDVADTPPEESTPL